ncbi:MAG: TlpA family protein disulfide reductase [Acidobacteriota bacterium]|nr:TlpA family protein disulfide reductase [Acidobacteriota bacterium]
MKPAIVLLAAAVTMFAAGDYSNRRTPGFSLTDSHYQQHDGQDYRGRVLLIDIMATTCPICQRLADVLGQVKAKYEDRIGIFSVVTLPDNFATGDRFAAEHNVHWPILFDTGQMIASYLRVTPANPQVHFPHLFVIDQEGFIRNDFEGSDDKALTLEGLSAEIDKLLKH